MRDAIEWEITDYVPESDLKGGNSNDERGNDYPAFFEW